MDSCDIWKESCVGTLHHFGVSLRSNNEPKYTNMDPGSAIALGLEKISRFFPTLAILVSSQIHYKLTKQMILRKDYLLRIDMFFQLLFAIFLFGEVVYLYIGEFHFSREIWPMRVDDFHP